MRKKTILVVDNQADYRRSLCDALSEHPSYEVIEAASVEETYTKVRTQSPQLAIVDVRLRDDSPQDWSGLYLARDLSNKVPILLMSFYGEKIAEELSAHVLPEFDQAAVAVGFYNKHDGSQILLEMVADLLRYPTAGRAGPPVESRRTVFLAYGHSEPARKTVVEFLQENGLRVLQVGQEGQYGDSVFDNVKRYVKRSHFGIVLFTADDEGYARKDGLSHIRKRPRMNVVFELGYLLSRLSTRRVRVLVEDDLEIPTNYSGILNIPLRPDQAWKATLARELRLAGININLKNVLGAGR